jgi:hypothetical protein
VTGSSQRLTWPTGVTSALYSSGMATAVKATVGTIGYARWGVATESGYPPLFPSCAVCRVPCAVVRAGFCPNG